MKTIGIIGFGRLGALAARYLARDKEVFVFEPRPVGKSIRTVGARPCSFAEACAQDVVIPCVPIGEFEAVIKKLARRVRPGALVVDVCSVKEHPVRLMKKHLPKTVDILATHPTFGPDSAAETLKGRKIAVCKVRIGGERYKRVKAYLERQGLNVVEMTPREHDLQTAGSLVLTHFIGRTLIATGSKGTEIDTEGYKRLLHILQTVQNDTWELFADMNKYNAYAKPMRARFLRAMKAIDSRLQR